jgi:hypothetical protein
MLCPLFFLIKISKGKIWTANPPKKPPQAGELLKKQAWEYDAQARLLFRVWVVCESWWSAQNHEQNPAVWIPPKAWSQSEAQLEVLFGYIRQGP